MRFKLFGSISLIFVLCGLGAGLSQNQDDEEVRGAFLSSREKTTTGTHAKGRHKSRRPGTKNANSNTAKNSNSGGGNNANAGPTSPPATPIGLGYTLFMRDSNGDPVRVDPSEEFHTGERVRIALEPNVDGYLYIFHSEGDGPPEMIFPDWRLDDGYNEIDAHVPYDVPSGAEKDERLRWFTFDATPATERLYIVVTREPLSAVPISEALVAFCATNKTKCPWKPVPEAWAKVQEAMKAEGLPTREAAA